MKISEFKARCLEIVEKLPEDGLLLTKRGHPVAKIVPIRTKSIVKRFYGCLKDEVKIHGDTLSTGVKWNAES